MDKKKRKNSPKQNSQSLLDKLIEQSFTLILSFIFATALIGGCTYLLFQFSSDLNSVNKESLEQEVRATQFSNFLDMTNVFLNGWFGNKSGISRFREIAHDIDSANFVENLDPTFLAESYSWIDDSLETISSEKGKISGYQFGEVEQDLQRNIIEEYDHWLNYLKVTDGILKNWNTDTSSERKSKIESLNELFLNSFSNLSEITSNLTQLLSEYEREIRFLEQSKKELNAKRYVLWTKFSLSSAGIIIGLAVFIYISKTAIKKFGVIT